MRILIYIFTYKIICTLSKPFFAATSLALFVKSPKVLLLTYVKSSSVFLLTPAAVLLASKAVFEASCTDFVASPTAFLVCCVNYLIYQISSSKIYQHISKIKLFFIIKYLKNMIENYVYLLVPMVQKDYLPQLL